MKIRFHFPAPILYTKKVTKGSNYVVRGKTIGPVIIIGESYERDLGLLHHELTHVKMFWLHGLLIHTYLYALIPKYRLYCEAKAYYIQWTYVSSSEREKRKEDFCDRIFYFYKLPYSRDYVKKYFYSLFPKG